MPMPQLLLMAAAPFAFAFGLWLGSSRKPACGYCGKPGHMIDACPELER